MLNLKVKQVAPDTETPVFIKLFSQVRPRLNALYRQSVQNKSDG